MINLRFRVAFLAVCVVFFVGKPVQAAAPIKVAVLPSILNLFIQYSVLNNILKEDPSLFQRTCDQLRSSISQRPGFVLSSKEFGTDSQAANELMKRGAYPDKKDRYDADLLILIGNASDKPYLEVFTVAVESGRAVSAFIDLREINNQNLLSLLDEAVHKTLDKSAELLHFEAGGIVDPKNAVVEYGIRSLSADEVLMRVDYDELYEKIEGVLFDLKNPRTDGEVQVPLATDSSYRILIHFVYENKKLKELFVDTDFRPKIFDKENPKTMTVLSENGYTLDFTFTFDHDGITQLDMKPWRNPYLPHVLPSIIVSHGRQ